MSVTAHNVMHVFGGGPQGLDGPGSLGPEQIAALQSAHGEAADELVDAELLGYHAEARLWAAVSPAHLVPTGVAIAAHPEVAFRAATTGPTNLLIAVVCRDSRDLWRYLTDRLAALPQNHTVETAPVIRTVKRAGPTCYG